MAIELHKWLMWTLFSLSLFSIAANTPATENTNKEDVHPFYVSVSEINHNAKEKSLEISCRIFIDDMEAALAKKYNTKTDLSDETKKAAMDKLLQDYLRQHFAVVVDGKAVALNYLGFEKDKESVWVYLEASGIAAPKKIDVRNSLLHDYINLQMNIIHVAVNGKRQSSKLDFPKKEVSFSF